MKISLNWVKEFTDIKVSSDELVELIGKRLGAVEDVIDLDKRYKGIVVAKIVSCESHPNADKLHVCLIDDGGRVKNVERNKDGLVQIVCGAPEVQAGMLVAWIPPGVAVPETYESEPLVLESRELRGVMSHGMLGTPRELGISQDHDRLLVIDIDAKPGDSFAELYQLNDTIIDLENKMFTHRPDCFGILGVARELSGIQHLPFKSPEWYLQSSELRSTNSDLPLEIQNEIPNLVPRFMAVAINGINFGPSPYPLQSFLSRVGIRPINNIVDVTNYVMHLTAQPMHAFDYHKIAKLSDDVPRLGVRMASDGELLTLLGAKQLKLTKDDMVLTTDKQAADLAGIMGGADTEVDENTTAIILTCGTFDMYAVRRSAMRHGVFTDAATRYTKGQSPLQNDRALAHATGLLRDFCGAHQASKVFDLRSKKYESGSMNQEVKIPTNFINDRLGIDLKPPQIKTLLENVEFSVNLPTTNYDLRISSPFWRTDIELPEDIVEEVGRLHGFDQLPLALPQRTLKPPVVDPLLDIKRHVRGILSRAGANEVLTYSFVHGKLLERAGQDPANSYQIANALSPELQYYRQTLMPNLLDKVHPNIKADHDEFALFELGKTHNKIHGLDEEKVPGEIYILGLTYASKKSKPGAAFYEARAFVDYLGTALGLELDYQPVDKDPGYPITKPYDLSRSAYVSVRGSGMFLGMVGEYRSEVAASFKLPAYAAGFEIGYDALKDAVTQSPTSSYQPLPTFPKVEQDMTLRVPSTVNYGQLSLALRESLDTLLDKTIAILSIEPLGIFSKDDSHTNVTYRFQIASYERTLTDKEVNNLLDKAAKSLAKTLKAERV
jgi:phenylalanyl-tRNA synthetase beta chain